MMADLHWLAAAVLSCYLCGCAVGLWRTGRHSEVLLLEGRVLLPG